MPFSRRHLCCLKRNEFPLFPSRSACFGHLFLLFCARHYMRDGILGVAKPHVVAIINALRFAKNALVLCLLAFGRPSGGSFICALFSFFRFSCFRARNIMFFLMLHAYFLISGADFSIMGAPGRSFYFLDCLLWRV